MDEIRNESRGSVAGNSVQIGAVHGDVAVPARATDQADLAPGQAALVRNLASVVRAASERELRKWSVNDRDALSVRWHTAAEELFDHWENIHGSADPVSLTGHFTTIRDTYTAIASKRLVILGRAGAGKTVLAHQLIGDLLSHTSSENAGPVPVLFSLGDWNPDIALSDWLSQQLSRDFPFLDATEPTTGHQQARVFVDQGLVMPVLDGFDELPEIHHRTAIRQISAFDVPLIVTSRPDEYAETARSIRPVGGAAAIALESLTLDEVHRYLRHSASKPRASVWDSLFEQLRRAPEDTTSRNLTAVLTTPLMVTLARTVYNDTPTTPSELLDVERFNTTTTIEDHLVESYFDTVYSRHSDGAGKTRCFRTDPNRARHWLSYLATHLKDRNSYDLAWWQLPCDLHPLTRFLLTVTALVILIPFTGVTSVYWSAIAPSTFDFEISFALGIAAGAINEVKLSRVSRNRAPERIRLSLSRRGNRPHSWSTNLKKYASRFTSGFIPGFAFGLVYWFFLWLPNGSAGNFWYYIPVGLATGTAVGIANVLVSALGETHPPGVTSPWTLLSSDRSTTLVRAIATIILVFAFSFGIQSWVLFLGSTHIVLGIRGLFTMAYAIGIARLALSTWGNWLLFTRFWLPLTGRLPWRPKRFLEDAYDRGVLRATGAVYQFRHAQLRNQLVNQTRHRTQT